MQMSDDENAGGSRVEVDGLPTFPELFDTEECGAKRKEDEIVIGADGKPLTKTQLKKLRARERYMVHRKEKRVLERERKRQKRQEQRETGQLVQRVRKGRKMAESTCKVRVALDMSFDELMTEKDLHRTVLQINWCYSVNRRSPQPLQFYVAGFNGPSRKVYDSMEGNQNQDIHLCPLSLDQMWKPDEIVYLTAESDNVLSSLDDSKVYVIGGLVDHNSQKGLCHSIAEKKNYNHARLPIDEFVLMKTRKVLTINHVFEILVHFSNNGNWEESFFKVMPKRKGMEKKDENDQGPLENDKTPSPDCPDKEGSDEDDSNDTAEDQVPSSV